ncbi:coiled-coil domain-containing protein 152 [Anolis carolinensis]|uniref:coiled-coil domain-containing protein 152 n=1 Tax=Anolis carolinensis TaxID=28377 RepID=UPI0002C88E66|nr:PREDICTED: coiled-coil domain-containing protein 152 [Anolis carolinensis]|eukprot:XP_008101042.1 PREDICTED: coiled-coil domain-containing protein 152 [Anolis carolinensis]
MKKNSLVNLDKLVEDFSHIEMKISELHGKNNLLNLQLDKTHKFLSISQSKEISAKEECATLQTVIKGLQQTIENQCNLRDENERLKNTAHMLEEKLKAHEQEHKNMVDRLFRQMESKAEEYKREQRKLHCDVNKKLEAKDEEHNQLIQKKDKEILEITSQLRAQEREKQNEIIKLQIEFNAKIARLQTKTPKPYPSPTVLPQTIFRRKLQHLEEEKNKEIEFLRNTIKDLEQRLGKRQDSRFRRHQF